MRITTDDGAVLRVREWGGGEPVLFVHGFPLSGEMWEPAARRLEDACRSLAPDLRGHGDSPPRGEPTLARHADDLVQLLEGLGERGAVTVVGLSMGGYVALELCRRHPDRVGRLVLVDTRAEADTEQAARDRRAAAERVLREGMEEMAEEMLPRLFARGASPALRTRWRAVMAATPPEGAAAALRAMASRPDSMPVLRSLRVPALVVVGAEDAVTPPEVARRMHEALPDSRLEVVPGAGHLTPLEQPDRFAALLRDFLGA